VEEQTTPVIKIATCGRFHHFVLQVYRDFVLTGATDWELLWDCWPAIVEALTYLKTLTLTLMAFQKIWCTDQTLDDWRLQGVSEHWRVVVGGMKSGVAVVQTLC